MFRPYFVRASASYGWKPRFEFRGATILKFGLDLGLSSRRRDLNEHMTESPRSITTLLFDWDGTLVDSAPLGLAAFQKAFAELGVPFSQTVYETAYSPNWYSIYEALELPRSEWERADSLWRKHYGDQSAQLVAD